MALFDEELIRISPALGTRVGYAAAVAEANGPETGLSVLDAIEPEGMSNYQPYWAVRGHLLQRSAKSVRPQMFMTARSAWPKTLL